MANGIDPAKCTHRLPLAIVGNVPRVNVLACAVCEVILMVPPDYAGPVEASPAVLFRHGVPAYCQGEHLRRGELAPCGIEAVDFCGGEQCDRAYCISHRAGHSCEVTPDGFRFRDVLI